MLAGPFAAKIPGDFAGDALGAGGTGAFGCTPRRGGVMTWRYMFVPSTSCNINYPHLKLTAILPLKLDVVGK